MSLDRSIEVVARFLEFRAAGNIDACLALVSESAVWHSPVGPPMRGQAGFRHSLSEAYSETQWFATEALAVWPQGGAVVAKVRNRGARRGATLDSVQLLVFRVANGLVVDVRIYVDDPIGVAEFWSA